MELRPGLNGMFELFSGGGFAAARKKRVVKAGNVRPN